MASFSFELVTPERVLWSGHAFAVSMRTDVGEVTFLANHSPLVGALDITVLRIEPAEESSSGADDHGDGQGSSRGRQSPDGGEEVRAAVHGGFVVVDENKVVLASGVAEMADEIDLARARRAFESATERVGEEAARDGEAPVVPPEAIEAEAAGPPSGRGVASAAFLDPRSTEAALRRAKVRIEAVTGSADEVA